MKAGNERRGEPRIATDLPVTVTVLGAAPQDALCGRILDMSGSGMLLSLPAAVPCGSPVKIEGGDMLLLGEVCRAEANPGPQTKEHLVGVTVRHSLSRLAQLERLNRALLGGAPAVRQEIPVAEPVEGD